MKLNLGSNETRIEGYINIDLVEHPNVDVVADVRKLPYENESVDEITNSHLLEHFNFFEGFEVLKEWYRVLRKGGILEIELPDFEAICKFMINATEEQRSHQYVLIWGCPWDGFMGHKFGYTPTQLKWTLEQVGFKNVTFVPIDENNSRFLARYPAHKGLCMKVRCKK
jgi:predicted SAM-dependent methyltransferase